MFCRIYFFKYFLFSYSFIISYFLCLPYYTHSI